MSFGVPAGAMSAFNVLGGNQGSFAPFDSSYSFGGGASSLVGTPDIGGMAGGIGAIGAGAGGMAGIMGPAGAALSAVETIGKLWMGFKQMKLAQKQFKYTKKITNQNLQNQMQSYNTALADRARSRGVMEGQSSDQVAQYIQNNSLYKGDPNKGKTAEMNHRISDAALNNYNQYLSSGSSGYSGSGTGPTPAAAPAPAATAPAASAAPAARGGGATAARDDQERG